MKKTRSPLALVVYRCSTGSVSDRKCKFHLWLLHICSPSGGEVRSQVEPRRGPGRATSCPSESRFRSRLTALCSLPVLPFEKAGNCRRAAFKVRLGKWGLSLLGVQKQSKTTTKNMDTERSALAKSRCVGQTAVILPSLFFPLYRRLKSRMTFFKSYLHTL